MTQSDEVGAPLWPEERVIDMRSLRQGSPHRGDSNDHLASVAPSARAAKTVGYRFRFAATLRSQASKLLFFVHRE